MKAIVYHSYGSPDVLKYEELEKPTAADDEVLIKIRAASVNPLDFHFMRGEPFVIRLMAGLRQPKDTRLGRDLSGQVEAVGRNVTEFKAGDEVFGMCRGAFAEYALDSKSELVTKPYNLTFEQAACVPVAALTALQGLRDKGKIQAGQKVLITGASGGVGTFAVQIAKTFDAEVTGVCSTRNVEMVRSIGADRVIDYTQEDFTNTGERYDLILDCYATHSLTEYRRALNPKGIYVGVGGPVGSMSGLLAELFKQLVFSLVVSQKFITFMAKPNKADLLVIRELIESGKVTPVIDRRYGLDEVPEAMRYMEEGHARGKVVITSG
ncbi:MAG TPA: NAD(P)-dependent alcohol dehydrogenase [Pyrinomonadaceae bacterium]|jgi:NADPH:quinone reductase-like Zn-dependent oxidoreductase